MEQAYAPYSRFKVGAAALVDDSRTVSGCNVENASYGATLCAECGLVSELVRSGGGLLVAVVCVDAHHQPCAPCGRCRQLLSEHAAPGLLLAMPSGIMTIEEILPDQFTGSDIARVTAVPGTAGAQRRSAGDLGASRGGLVLPGDVGAAPGQEADV
ncbi:cytidine deaminase [Actinomyces sp. 2119]|nr:cytidine deaminase [Actinomyces sp. 2119]